MEPMSRARLRSLVMLGTVVAIASMLRVAPDTFCGASVAVAGEVEVVRVEALRTGDTWRFDVTLRHEDEGWEHYADEWRVVTTAGAVLGRRVLRHPHVDEQPFTRSLPDVRVPAETSVVYVEAHDKVHGWAPQRVEVDLRRDQGERFRVRR